MIELTHKSVMRNKIINVVLKRVNGWCKLINEFNSYYSLEGLINSGIKAVIKIK